jgi:hypothetical protein
VRPTPDIDISWTDVWKLYARYPDVFLGVLVGLRRRGWRIPTDVEHDLIHEFLIKRARPMLAKYEPERGRVQGLLAVAFRNFVISELRTTSHQEELWASELERISTQPTLEDDDQHHRLDVDKVLSTVSSEKRIAVKALIDSGSLRAAARALGLSRWEIRKRIAEVLAQVSLRTQVSS